MNRPNRKLIFFFIHFLLKKKLPPSQDCNIICTITNETWCWLKTFYERQEKKIFLHLDARIFSFIIIIKRYKLVGNQNIYNTEIDKHRKTNNDRTNSDDNNITRLIKISFRSLHTLLCVSCTCTRCERLSHFRKLGYIVSCKYVHSFL